MGERFGWRVKRGEVRRLFLRYRLSPRRRFRNTRAQVSGSVISLTPYYLTRRIELNSPIKPNHVVIIRTGAGRLDRVRGMEAGRHLRHSKFVGLREYKRESEKTYRFNRPAQNRRTAYDDSST